MADTPSDYVYQQWPDASGPMSIVSFPSVAREKLRSSPAVIAFQVAKEGWLMAIASYPNLSGSDCAVAITIAKHLNTTLNEAWPSMETIAKLTNRKQCTVWRSIRRLEQLGLLTVLHSRGRHRSNRYRPAYGHMGDDPKTLRRRKKRTASWQRKPCDPAERTLEEP